MSYLRENWILELIWVTVHNICGCSEDIDTPVVLIKVQRAALMFRLLNTFTHPLVSSILSLGIPFQDV